MTTKKKVAAFTGRAIARARVAGKTTAKRLIAAADAELVKQGKAAHARRRKRVMKAALKRVAGTLALAGTTAAAVLGARAATRAVRGKAPEE